MPERAVTRRPRGSSGRASRQDGPSSGSSSDRREPRARPRRSAAARRARAATTCRTCAARRRRRPGRSGRPSRAPRSPSPGRRTRRRGRVPRSERGYGSSRSTRSSSLRRRFYAILRYAFMHNALWRCCPGLTRGSPSRTNRRSRGERPEEAMALSDLGCPPVHPELGACYHGRDARRGGRRGDRRALRRRSRASAPPCAPRPAAGPGLRGRAPARLRPGARREPFVRRPPVVPRRRVLAAPRACRLRRDRLARRVHDRVLRPRARFDVRRLPGAVRVPEPDRGARRTSISPRSRPTTGAGAQRSRS